MNGTPSRLATSRAVPGMSCIRPSAPEGETAAALNELSWRVTASASARSIEPVAPRSTTGKAVSNKVTPFSVARRATVSATSGRFSSMASWASSAVSPGVVIMRASRSRKGRERSKSPAWPR
jgi:hypothetical protein